MKNYLAFFCIFYCVSITSQDVGIQTLMPDAPLHVWSNGQVYTSGGLMLLGDRSNGSLELDFGRVQTMFSGSPLDLRLQPDGGKVGANIPFPSALEHVFQVEGTVGITGGLYHVDDFDTYLQFTPDLVRLGAGGLNNLIVRPHEVNLGDEVLYVDVNQSMVGVQTSFTNHTLKRETKGI